MKSLRHAVQYVLRHVQMQGIVFVGNTGVFHMSGSKTIEKVDNMKTGFAHKNSTNIDRHVFSSACCSVRIATCTNARNRVCRQ